MTSCDAYAKEPVSRNSAVLDCWPRVNPHPYQNIAHVKGDQCMLLQS